MNPLTDATILASIIGLVAVAQQIGMPSRISPAVAIVLGIAYACAAVVQGHGTLTDAAVAVTAVSTGVGYGLSAVGLHSTATKSVAPMLKRATPIAPPTTPVEPPAPTA